MRSSLPNTNIVYDGPRKEEMQEFLDFMYEIRKQNPNMIFTGDTVYSQLRDRGLPRSDRDEFGKGLDVRRFFDRWQNDFKGRKTWTGVTRNFWYWFQFVNGTRDEKEFIKLYIPINMPHLYEGVKQLFDFIDREGIQHQSKVGQNMRIDNVIVRLKKGDIASANKIIDFINNNPYLRTGLNKNNPFIPTVKGIGYMDEHGNSYNTDLSELIHAYLTESFEKGRTRVTVEGLRDYIRKYCRDESLIETFEIAYTGKKPQKKEEDKKELSMDQKIGLLMDCIKATYSKYGYEQVEYALISAITAGNYNYFTNGTTNLQLREELKKNISGEQIGNIIRTALDGLVPQRMISKDPIKNIKLYCRTILSDRMTFSLDEACMATLEKYGRDQLFSAIFAFAKYNNPDRFTRFYKNSKVNYRDVIVNIGKDNMMYLIERSLMAKGYDIVGLEETEKMSTYITMLEMTNYYNFEDRPKMM